MKVSCLWRCPHKRSPLIDLRFSLSLSVFLTLSDKCIQFTALMWMKTFLTLAQRSMMVFTSNILVSILPCVAYDNDKSRIPSQHTHTHTHTHTNIPLPRTHNIIKGGNGLYVFWYHIVYYYAHVLVNVQDCRRLYFP